MPAGRRVPLERPLLPVVGPVRRLELGLEPFAFTRDADADVRDRTWAGPGFPSNDMGAGAEERTDGGGSDAGAHTHEVDRPVWLVGPLVDVVARLELAWERLCEDVDSLQPLHGCNRIPVRHDQSKRCPVIAVQGLAVHLVSHQALGPWIDHER